MMSDLSVRNTIEKFIVFETRPKSFSRKTSGSLHGARSFPITQQAVQFSRQNPYPDIFQSVFYAKKIFLLGIFSKISKKFKYYRIFYCISNLLQSHRFLKNYNAINYFSNLKFVSKPFLLEKIALGNC